MNQILEVNRTSVGDTRLVEVDEPELADGQVRLHVDRFAVTANNITYAVFGDMLGYWNFFPADDAGWGRVPAMGWATVVESRNPDLAVGSRYYGWYPMARTVVFDATATDDGFRDDGEHRQQHAPVYRSYVATDCDPSHDDAPDGEDRHSLLRGLFFTGYLADESFDDACGTDADSYFGAGQVVVLSASSKTGIAFAQRVAARRDDGADLRTIGLTSPGNVEFVESLGWYDTVLTYDDVASIPADVPSVSIDMAGNPSVLAAVHHHLGDQLKYSMTVGRSHHDAPPADSAGELPGPTPTLFFAPTAAKRGVIQWGTEGYAQRSSEALHDFVDASRSWLTVDRRTGPDGVQSAWADVYAGAVAPSVGVVAGFDAPSGAS